MDAAQIERIETNVERAASAIFAGAAGCAVYALARSALAPPQAGIGAVVAAVFGYVLCNGALGVVTPRKPRFAVPVFDLREIDADELLLTSAHRVTNDELVLTESDRLDGNELILSDSDRLAGIELLLTDADRLHAPADAEPLVLDDLLAELGSDSRVVRLFDRKAMPTPGQLKSRIDDHLEQGERRSGASDASQALSDALAELRRSLR